MDNRQYNKGTEGNKGGGRKPKELNKQLIKKLTPMNSIALTSLRKALDEDKPWAIKLYFEYYYGRPQQRLDVTSGDEPFAMKPLFTTDFLNVPTDNSTGKDK